jgi:hypothetical protein
MEIRTPRPNAMKRNLFFAVLISAMGGMALSAPPLTTPTPTPFDASKIDYSKFTPEEIAATEAHRSQLKSQVKSNLSTIVTTSDSQGAALQQAQKSLDLYEAAVKTRIDQGNAAIASLASLVKKHHLDLMILIGLWVGFVALLYLKAGTMLGPVGIYIAAGLAVGGSAFILFRL